MSTPAYKRILLKLSGEALAAGQGFGVDNTRVHEIAAEIAEVHHLGVEIAIVVGGGNFFRGVAEQAKAMERVSADHMGMLATVINALALQDALEKVGAQTRVMSAIEMHEVAEPFIRRRAIRHMEKGRVVVFAAGTGNPYFSTDTAASLRAMEIHADAIRVGEKVLLVDDLIATGGTASAAVELIRRSGGEIVAAAFVINLPDLGGTERLRREGVEVHTLVDFEGH